MKHSPCRNLPNHLATFHTLSDPCWLKPIALPRFQKNHDLDTIAPLHHGAIMRLTINLDDDLYAMARSHAIATKTSISKAVGDLLRRKTTPNTHTASGFPLSNSNFHVDPDTLLPVVKGSGSLTNEMVQRMIDDDLVRPLQIMGYSDDQIEEMLEQ